jgi:hypothetical protein
MSINPNGINGGFIAVPTAFEGAPTGSLNVLKLEFIPKLVKIQAQGTSSQTIDVDIVSHRALIDFAEFDQDDVDYDRLERDCDLLKEAFRSHRRELTEAMKIISNRDSTPEMVEDVAKMLDEIGFSERGFLERDGGILPLLIILAAALVADGCAHTDWAKRKQQEAVPPSTR